MLWTECVSRSWDPEDSCILPCWTTHALGIVLRQRQSIEGIYFGCLIFGLLEASRGGKCINENSEKPQNYKVHFDIGWLDFVFQLICIIAFTQQILTSYFIAVTCILMTCQVEREENQTAIHTVIFQYDVMPCVTVSKLIFLVYKLWHQRCQRGYKISYNDIQQNLSWILRYNNLFILAVVLCIYIFSIYYEWHGNSCIYCGFLLQCVCVCIYIYIYLLQISIFKSDL